MSDTAAEPQVEDEVILDESVADDQRRIRVYGPRADDDFVIEVPAGSKVTFGYFNPAAAGESNPNNYGMRENVAKQTALRIYERGEKGNQLACFLGVRGFRDESIKRTNLVQRVVVERRYQSDGDGNEEWSGNQQREILARAESSDDIPF